jgi:nitrate/nitrite transporter NarK
LAQNGREVEAAAVAERLTGQPVEVTEADRRRSEPVPEGIRAVIQPRLFRRDMLRRTIFTSVPWFLMDAAFYGVGIFTPTLLAALALGGADATFIRDDIEATTATAILDVFLVAGFVTAIFLVDRVGRIPLQIVGLTMMAVALSLLGVGELQSGSQVPLGLVIAGFVIFQFFVNAGPNATTFALPAEVFPSEIRAAGHGFAAASAKLGAALGVFFFPILIEDIGTSGVLFILAGGCLIAAAVTLMLRIEPKGRALNEISGEAEAEALLEVEPHPAPP